MTAATVPAELTLGAQTRLEMTGTLLDQADALGLILDDLDAVSDAELYDLFLEHEVPPLPMPAREGGAPGGFERLIADLPDWVNKYTAAAGLIAAVMYRQLAPELDYDPEPLYDIPPDRIENSARWALFAPGEESPLARFAASKGRMIRDASRQTIAGNAAAEGVRYLRIAQPDACAFCRVLATRGALDYAPYHRSIGAKRVGFSESGIRGPRTKGMLYHDRCRCEPMAIRGDMIGALPGYYTDWTDEYFDARRGIEDGNILATELGISGEVPNIRNVTQYMRHAQARATGVREPVTEPFRKPKKVEAPKPEPAWKRMPRNTWQEIQAQFEARTGIDVKSDRTVGWKTGKAPPKNAFGRTDDLGMLREYTDTLAELNEKYGIADMAVANNIQLSMGTSSRFGKDYAFAWVQPGQGGFRGTSRNSNGYVEMMFNRGWLKDRAAFDTTSDGSHVAREWRYGIKGNPRLRMSDGTYAKTTFSNPRGSKSHVWYTTAHETGHVMDNLTLNRPRRQAMQRLTDTFLDTHPQWQQDKAPRAEDYSGVGAHSRAYGEFSRKRDGALRDWMYNSMSAYSFNADGSLNAAEAIAESFAWGEAVGPENVSDAARVLHDLTVQEYVYAQQQAAAA